MPLAFSLLSVSLTPYLDDHIRPAFLERIEVVEKTHSLFSLIGKHQLEVRKSGSWIERSIFHHHGTFNPVIGHIPHAGAWKTGWPKALKFGKFFIAARAFGRRREFALHRRVPFVLPFLDRFPVHRDVERDRIATRGIVSVILIL